MGAKASTIWYIDAPDPISLLREATASDWNAATALVARLLPDQTAVPTDQRPISDAAAAEHDEVFIGCYRGVTVVCGPAFSVPKPSLLPESVIRSPRETDSTSSRTYLIATDPSSAWGAFAYWERGELRRSFSATPIYIHEDTGLPLVWERTFWAGEHPLVYPPDVMPDPQSLPFHPQEFAETANAEWLGFRYTGAPRGDEFDPRSLPVCGFRMYAPGQAPVPAEAPREEPQLRQPRERSLTRWWRRKSPEPRS
ncbi:MAG: hypothetical protein WBQ44_09650 [Rhodococcus sp. (in: high G+C Gram-positive bacteria)]